MGVNELKTKAINPTDCVFGVTMDGQLYHEPLSSMVHVLVAGTTGCHAKGELILMADGTSKPVELINGGDKIMGGDGTPRTVLCPRHGFDTMYELNVNNRGTIKVNGGHNLILFNHDWGGNHEKTMTVNEFLELSPYQQSRCKLCACEGIEKFDGYDDSMITIDPYMLGIFIGDGGTHGNKYGCPNITTADKEIVDAIYDYAEKLDCLIRVSYKGGKNKAKTYYIKRNDDNPIKKGRTYINPFKDLLKELGLNAITCGEKFIPDVYKFGTIETRRQVLAGLIDSDGYLNRNAMIDYTTKSKQLADDVVFVGRSLGLQVSCAKCKKSIKSLDFVGEYYRLGISGNLEQIPTRLPRKKYIPKEHRHLATRIKFSIEKISDNQEYFGFTCDGDHTYLPQSMVRSCQSGKSVAINSYLISMMSHATPNELRMFIIDPKKVEFSAYKGLPYCPVDPVTDMRDAYGLLAFSVWEMERRYKVLQSVGVKQLSEFNEFADKNPDNPIVKREGKMPYFIFLIDEYADLMDSMKKDSAALETLCSRLAQKGRASGIILILATQRPSADIVTPKLRSNFPSRICLTVADSISSSIALGDAGQGYDGSQLKGKGDGYVLSFDTKKVTRCQSLFISNEEIDAVFRYIRDKYKSKEDYYKKYVPDAVYDYLSDESKKLVEKCGNIVNYKVLTTDKEACNFVDNRTPFCSWVKGEDPETFPNNPEKWHVAVFKESRIGGMF